MEVFKTVTLGANALIWGYVAYLSWQDPNDSFGRNVARLISTLMCLTSLLGAVA